MTALPAPAPDALVRVLATNSLLGTVTPMPATYGQGGSIAGVIALFQRQSEALPTVWVDSGDLTMGGPHGAFGLPALLELGPLPLSVAAAGNHELEGGIKALHKFATQVSFPIVCADRDVGLPATAMIDTPGGAIGVVGLTHPFAHEFYPVAQPDTDAAVIAEHARQLRRDGARWVLALLHDGATWWASPDTDLVMTRDGWLNESTAAWAASFDAILGGHTLVAWVGELHGTPAGQAHAYAASVLPVDLCASPPCVRIHRPTRVPAVTPQAGTPTSEALHAADATAIGELTIGWESRAGTKRYLPNLIAAALRTATGADAAFVPAGQLLTQAPIDGVVAALRGGTVTELDILRLHPFDERVEVVDLKPGEFRTLLARHDRAADPDNVSGDGIFWNWARAPAGAASISVNPMTVAVRQDHSALPQILLDRALTTHRTSVTCRQATRRLIADAGPASELGNLRSLRPEIDACAPQS